MTPNLVELVSRIDLARRTLMTATLSQSQTRVTVHRTRAKQIADTLDEAAAALRSRSLTDEER